MKPIVYFSQFSRNNRTHTLVICLSYTSFSLKCNIIRIFNGCEVRIENSVMRVTVRHHKACTAMPKSYLERWNFHFTPNNHYGFFFLHACFLTLAFKLKYVLSVKQFSVRLLSATFTSKRLAENDVKTDAKKTSWHHERGSSYPPPQHFLAQVSDKEILVDYARMPILT